MATALFVVLNNGFGAGVVAFVLVPVLVGVKAGTTGVAEDSFCRSLSARLRPLPVERCALSIERKRASPRKTPAQYLVIFVSAVPEPAKR